MGKVVDFDYLIPLSNCKDISIVLCHGCFDLLHPGHIKHLQKAKELGDILVVTVTPDRFVNKGPGRPVYNENIRLEALAALDCVDFVALNKWPTAYETITRIQPSIYVKGKDWEDSLQTNEDIRKEKEMVEKFGGRIEFTNEITFSSSGIINTYTDLLTEDAKVFLNNLKKKYTIKDIEEVLDSIKDLKVLVIGEAIIDEYQYGVSIGKSGKAPIVAFRNGEIERYAGGALAVANHVSNFCKTTLFTLIGSKDKEFIKTLLNKNIIPVFISNKRSTTIRKRRYVESGQKLFETYSINDESMDSRSETEACKILDTLIPQYDIVLVADFGNGMITKNIRDKIKTLSKYVAVNTQSNAGNMGFHSIRKYNDRKSDIYICIDENEARLATHENYNNTEEIIDIIKKEFENTDIVAITRGSRGCIMDGKRCEDPIVIPAFATKIVDIVGTGDAFLSITSPLTFVDVPVDLIGFLGSVAGAIACTYQGNKEFVTRDKLCRYSETLLK